MHTRRGQWFELSTEVWEMEIEMALLDDFMIHISEAMIRIANRIRSYNQSRWGSSEGN
jgi:hypothetical protein